MNHALDLLVGIVSLLLIYTKYLDCRSTAERITHVGQELNPMARGMMYHRPNWSIC